MINMNLTVFNNHIKFKWHLNRFSWKDKKVSLDFKENRDLTICWKYKKCSLNTDTELG